MPSRTTRRRAPSVRADLAITAVVLMVLALAAWISLTAQGGLPLSTHFTIHARFADVSGLQAGDDVRIAGVRIGQVQSLSTSRTQATVTLELDSHPALPVDTRAVVRSRGLLGARYLELIPGTAHTLLHDGASIPVADTGASNDVSQVLATFDAPTRAHIRQLIAGAGRGLLAHGLDLNELLRTSPTLVDDLDAISTAVNARTGAAQRLVPSIESTISALYPVRNPLADAFSTLANAAVPFASETPAIEQTLRIAPNALTTTGTSLDRTDPLLVQARGLAQTAATALRGAPAGLSATARLLAATPTPLARAATLLDRAQAAADPTREMILALPPVVTMLDRTFPAATPLIDKLGQIDCDVHAFATGWASMLGVALKSKQGDPKLGPLTSLRLTATGNPDTLHPLVTTLTGATQIGTDAYPAPCQAGTEKLK